MHSLDQPAPASARVVSIALQQALQSADGLLDRLPIGVYSCDANGLLVQYNGRAAELWGQSPVVGDSGIRFCGAWRAYSLDGALLDLADSPVAEVLRTAQPVRDRELILERSDGGRSHILANADPLSDHTGRLVGAVNCIQDITELRRQGEELKAREQWYRDLLEALPAAVYTTDAEGRITFFNSAAAEFAGSTPTLGEDRWCVTWKLRQTDGTPLPHDQCPMATTIRAGEAVRGVEAIAERPDGRLVPFQPYPTPLRDEDGRMIGAVNMLVDITERKQAEERQRVLIDELNHRVKNTLATVQSIAVQTARSAASLQAFSSTFESRLMALSKTHDLLTGRHWEGANLHDILGQELAPFGDQDPDRVQLEGPLLTLKPYAAVALAMVLHELATNAAKYGALSSAKGRLHVSWRAHRRGSDDAALVLAWSESAGPPVAKPEATGFGTRFIERTVASELGGSCRLRYQPSGLRCEIKAPLSHVRA